MRLLIPWLFFILLPLRSLVSPWTFPAVSPRRFFWKQQQRQRIVCIVQDGIATTNTTTSTTTLDGEDDGQYMQVVDSHFMKLALEEAKKAKDRGEVPIGALVVRPLVPSESASSMGNTTSNDSTRRTSFEVLGFDSNRVEQWQDASAHAELLAMRQAAHNNHISINDNNKVSQDGNWRLLNATLYTTLEPCAMCLAAAQAFRVHRIVYGAPDLRIGAIDTYLQLLEVPHPTHTINHVVRGVHQEECADLMRSFFRERRQKQPPKNLQPKGAASSWRARTMTCLRRFLFRKREK